MQLINSWFVKVRATLGSVLEKPGMLQKLGLLVFCLALAVGMQIQYPRFLSLNNIEVMMVNFVSEGIMALGMTIVMITGGIDISIPAVLQFSAILTAMLLGQSVPIPLAILIALLTSGVIGFINIFLTNKFDVHPFIVTLATLLTLRGVNIIITNAGTITIGATDFSELGRGTFLDIPHIRWSLILFFLLALIVGYVLSNHSYLQKAYFIGGNRRSARLLGINVENYLTFVYIFNSVLAGLAGVVIASQYGAASVSFGQNAELRTITIAAVGGASFTGGSGSISGTFLGWLFLAMVYNAFNMSGIDTYWQDVVIGVLLLLAVFFSEFVQRRKLLKK